jgi:hypothetical protein
MPTCRRGDRSTKLATASPSGGGLNYGPFAVKYSPKPEKSPHVNLKIKIRLQSAASCPCGGQSRVGPILFEA